LTALSVKSLDFLYSLSPYCFSFSSYTQELPTRFKKDVFRAAVQEPESDHIALSGLTRVLANIGASDRLSYSEMEIIFQELGNEMGEIHVQRMASIF
jgi:hypothetical protein